ncbi:exodeoxyribonuclease V subunit gamma [Vibrio sp. 10N.286.49.C2]|uniref:exodeoxyribonuclease V subunit gamma n=1 Tax=unclassified Vibrio TaxID=2614977 RepID=UPI000C842A86|nr:MULTISPECIES: exodeoxyribonuclease V subunit gamma [unclassified Vibrio]PMH38915.1 exodeoxyribonuclease V subunit gamma [Vibrio sp. 10N.286.49.C2]PMH55390.1 exodeoxyribonuclease V subunit gamma [Vibrio sp. 10N.286.49.B1]PMH80885.1 exodeoxyribonuclease V subunit gamma [Vibrio sp. 10N.286.48.B7]
MFTVYHSNQIDVLKSLLVQLIKIDPLANPFEKEQILVQSPGMSQWLNIAMAQEFGIAANTDFPLPATFIWERFTQVLDDVPQRSAFNKEAMTWKIMHLLPHHLGDEDFAPLAQYLEHDDDASKRYQLAEKIADIYDGYLVYRPEWIAAWESGQSVPDLEDEQPWQPKLWQSLYDHTLALGQSPYHRANLYEHFIDTLAHSRGEQLDARLAGLPKRLFVFGISSLPPRYLDALKALGQHIDVHLMFTNPCRYYWGDVRDRKYLARLAASNRKHLQAISEVGDVSECHDTPTLKGSVDDNVDDELHVSDIGNSLLASMGKLGRDNLYLLSQLESNEIEAFVDIDRDSLLHHIQADILGLEEHQNDSIILNSEHKPDIASDDRSLTLHVCHSAMREVEALYDNLLTMFDNDPQLKPRDIIVMVADINAYSPSIQAVFGNAAGERYIPFSISDRTADKESPLLNAFNQLLALPELRCTSSELLELLDVPAILARFDLDEQEYAMIKLWVDEAQVRWGIDEHTAHEFDLPEFGQNSWMFGISRMLAGYAISEESGLLCVDDDVIAPYEQTQGMRAETAGKLAQFIDTIAGYRQRLSMATNIEQWRTVINQLVDDFFKVELEGEVVIKSIRDTISGLQEQLQDACFDEHLSPKIVRQYFINKLSGSRVSQRFLAGQVNFCTLMPMRSIPFKVVCLLGMNDGVYPRSVPPESFDLMTGRTRAGDRSRRDDDRYLFLEALLSAQQSLYISYVGRSIQDNTERVPSVLVSELMEYCQQNYRLPDDGDMNVDDSGQRLNQRLTQEYPMVPFSPSHFDANSDKQSYAAEWLPTARQSSQEQTVQSAATHFVLPPIDRALGEVVELDLTELQRFWRLPVQYLFNRRLQVSFDQQHFMVEEDEPFALNGLESFGLRNELLSTLVKNGGQLSESAMSDFQQQQKAQGFLPVRHFGDLELAGNMMQTQELAQAVAALTTSAVDDCEVNQRVDLGHYRIRLQGWITGQYSSGLVRYRSGRLRANDYLSAWIDHLLLAVTGSTKATHMLAYDKKEGVVHRVLPALDAEFAAGHLKDLLSLFVEGLDQPLAYFPETAMAGIEANFSRGAWKPDDEKMLSKMEAKFIGGYMMIGEGGNPYISRVWPQWDDNMAQESKQLAARVLQAPRTMSQSAEDFYSMVPATTNADD